MTKFYKIKFKNYKNKFKMITNRNIVMDTLNVCTFISIKNLRMFNKCEYQIKFLLVLKILFPMLL